MLKASFYIHPLLSFLVFYFSLTHFPSVASTLYLNIYIFLSTCQQLFLRPPLSLFSPLRPLSVIYPEAIFSSFHFVPDVSDVPIARHGIVKKKEKKCVERRERERDEGPDLTPEAVDGCLYHSRSLRGR